MFSLVFVSLIPGATVREIEPKYGSLAGETRITIYGSGKYLIPYQIITLYQGIFMK